MGRKLDSIEIRRPGAATHPDDVHKVDVEIFGKISEDLVEKCTGACKSVYEYQDWLILILATNKYSFDKYIFVVVGPNFDVNYFHLLLWHAGELDQILLQSVEIMFVEDEFGGALASQLAHVLFLIDKY